MVKAAFSHFMSFPLTFGNFLSPMETKNNEFPSSALPEEQADLSKTELRKKKVESLRKIAREVVGSGSWIASARKSTLVSAILHGQEYAEIDRLPDEAVSPIVRVVTENIQSAVQPLSEEISQSSKIMRGARKENAASRKQTERLTEHIKSLDDTMQTIAGAVQNLVEIERRRQEMFDEMILASEDSSATQSSSERKEAPPSTPPPYDHSLSPVQGQDPRPLQSDDRPLRELFEAVSLFGKTRSNRSYAA